MGKARGACVRRARWGPREGAAHASSHLVPDLAKGIAEQGAHHVNLKGAQLAGLLIARVLQGRKTKRGGRAGVSREWSARLGGRLGRGAVGSAGQGHEQSRPSRPACCRGQGAREWGGVRERRQREQVPTAALLQEKSTRLDLARICLGNKGRVASAQHCRRAHRPSDKGRPHFCARRQKGHGKKKHTDVFLLPVRLRSHFVGFASLI